MYTLDCDWFVKWTNPIQMLSNHIFIHLNMVKPHFPPFKLWVGEIRKCVLHDGKSSFQIVCRANCQQMLLEGLAMPTISISVLKRWTQVGPGPTLKHTRAGYCQVPHNSINSIQYRLDSILIQLLRYRFNNTCK